jgi:hypothetical protein
MNPLRIYVPAGLVPLLAECDLPALKPNHGIPAGRIFDLPIVGDSALWLVAFGHDDGRALAVLRRLLAGDAIEDEDRDATIARIIRIFRDTQFLVGVSADVVHAPGIEAAHGSPRVIPKDSPFCLRSTRGRFGGKGIIL